MRETLVETPPLLFIIERRGVMDQTDVVYMMDLVNNHSDLAKRVAALETKVGAGSASTNTQKQSAVQIAACLDGISEDLRGDGQLTLSKEIADLSRQLLLL